MCASCTRYLLFRRKCAEEVGDFILIECFLLRFGDATIGYTIKTHAAEWDKTADF